MVKKNIVVMLCIACMLPALVCTAFANEGYAVHPQQSLPEMIMNLLKGDSAIVLLDCNPSSGTVEYVSWVSYDYLSELSTKWDTAGVIVYNSTMKAYFIRVSFIPTISTSGTYEYCSLGTTNGYVLGAKKDNGGDLENVSGSINESLWLTRRHVINILNRCNDFYVQLNYLCDRMDSVVSGVNNLIQTNSLLSNIIRYLDVLADDLETDDSPLLTRLDSIINALLAQNNTSNNYYSDLNALLAALRSSLENLTINADNLENLTIDAYDDSTLMSYVDTISMNTDLINAWVASVNSNVSSISKDLGFVRRSATTIATHITNIDSAFTSELLPAVTDCSTKLSQLAASGGETPTTLHDYISMRIVPLQVSLGNNVSLMVNTTSAISTKLSTLSDTATSISGVAAENNTILSRMDTNLATLTSSVDSIAYAVGNGGLQGRNLMNLLDSVNTRVEAVRKAVVTLSPYDDTNMIAAVNSVETALSNLSFSGEVNTDLTPVITSIDAVGVNIEDLNANFNTSLGSLVDKLDVIVDKSSESMENLTVEISVDNDAHNVFYITDEDGNEESLVDFSGDVLKAGGKLLNFLFKVCFDGAIDNLDGSIDDMDSFYFDGAELGGSLWE